MAKRNAQIDDFIEEDNGPTKLVQADIPEALYNRMKATMANRPKKLTWKKFIEASCLAFLAQNEKSR